MEHWDTNSPLTMRLWEKGWDVSKETLMSENHPVVELACSSVQSLYPIARNLVGYFIKKNLKVAIVVRDGDGPEECSLLRDPIYVAGGDLYMCNISGIFVGTHRGERSDETALVVSLLPDYDLVLVLGSGRSLWQKIWFCSPGEIEPPHEISGTFTSLPLTEKTENIGCHLCEAMARAWSATPLWGCILIGGKSSRMGTPKHLIRENGDKKTWVERTAELLAPYTENVVLAGGGEVPDSLAGLTRIPDIPGVPGPVTGLLAAMRWQPQLSWLLVACDMPRVQPEALKWLTEQRKPGDWAVLPRLKGSNNIEPLLAVYDYRCASLYEGLLMENCLRIGAVGSHEKVATPVIPASLAESWRNVNTPEELARISHR